MKMEEYVEKNTLRLFKGLTCLDVFSANSAALSIATFPRERAFLVRDR